MPGVTISVRCVDCSWQATVSEGGYVVHDGDGLVVSVGPRLCTGCANVVTVENSDNDDEAQCPGCGETALVPWPGRDEALLLHRAATAGKFGGCPKCDGRVEAFDEVVLWD